MTRYNDRVKAWRLGIRHAYEEAKHDRPPSRQIHWSDERLNMAYDAGLELGEGLAIPVVVWRHARAWWEDFKATYLP